ncbi:hypothetical protein FLAG1_11342 [Fusarium langsethiae]|uniref:2EXR domain-containing protein n=1 Tax=Fusarium langsethiae TaxID=179993 RepID=A0A0M9EM86_FUSLA|nr:hypothetical protein FLAG1_11342 [Fusarium langsethiae]
MASSVFHPFARLPVELRLQIWDAACVGSPASQRGLQYIDVRNDEAVPIPCDWPKAPGQISTTRINRSAYMIDGGLWRACKESREVIAKNTHFKDWVRIQKRAIVHYEYFYRCSAGWPGGNKSTYPAIINTCEGEEEFRMLVYPANDIFCIQVDDWIDLREQVNDPDIYMSLIRYKRNYHEDDYEDDVGWSIFSELRLKNIALEFDSSWLVDLPEHIYDLADENSARGYLAKLLKQKAYGCLPFCFKGEGIWIVDKEAKWFGNADEHHYMVYRDGNHDTVYQDCDGEYIEVSCDQFTHRYSYDGEFPNAVVFLQRLNSLSFHDCYFEPESPDPSEELPEPENMVKLLVRRDNEVKKTTRRCKRKCDRLGWCICSDDRGNWWEDEDEDMDANIPGHLS